MAKLTREEKKMLKCKHKWQKEDDEEGGTLVYCSKCIATPQSLRYVKDLVKNGTLGDYNDNNQNKTA